MNERLGDEQEVLKARKDLAVYFETMRSLGEPEKISGKGGQCMVRRTRLFGTVSGSIK